MEECEACKQTENRTGQRETQEDFCTNCKRQGHSNREHIAAYMGDIRKEVDNLNQIVEQKVTYKYVSKEFAKMREERDHIWRIINQEARKLAKI